MTTLAQTQGIAPVSKKPCKRMSMERNEKEHKKKLKMARQWIEDLGGDANEFETVMNDIFTSDS